MASIIKQTVNKVVAKKGRSSRFEFFENGRHYWGILNHPTGKKIVLYADPTYEKSKKCLNFRKKFIQVILDATFISPSENAQFCFLNYLKAVRVGRKLDLRKSCAFATPFSKWNIMVYTQSTLVVSLHFDYA